MMFSLWKKMFFGPLGEAPSPAAMFFYVVLPVALIPPAMLMMSEGGIEAFLANTHAILEGQAAAAVFFTEILTVFVMTWVIRDVAKTLKLHCSLRDAFIVAALCPLPLWLSSIALVSADRAFLLLAFAAGLLGSAILLHQSVRALFTVHDDEEALALSSTAFSVAGIVWFLLATSFVVP